MKIWSRVVISIFLKLATATQSVFNPESAEDAYKNTSTN